MDIKELMRTYVFINDPKVRQITTKFGAVLIALGGIAGIAWIGVGLADDATDEPNQPAADIEDDYDETECMDPSQLDAWRLANPDILNGDHQIHYRANGDVCVHH